MCMGVGCRGSTQGRVVEAAGRSIGKRGGVDAKPPPRRVGGGRVGGGQNGVVAYISGAQ